MNHDKELNTQGLSCPIPLVKMAHSINAMKPGEIIKITGDDPIFEGGVQDFCEGNHYKLLKTEFGTGRIITVWVKV